MAKKVETYNDVAHENDSRKMIDHINSKNAEWEAVEEGRNQKQAEERETANRVAVVRYTWRCIVSVLVFVALYAAMHFELIVSVLAIPATYLCALCFGWSACKVGAFAKKVRGSK